MYSRVLSVAKFIYSRVMHSTNYMFWSFMHMESCSMKSFLSGFLHVAELPWDSSIVLQISIAGSYSLLSSIHSTERPQFGGLVTHWWACGLFPDWELLQIKLHWTFVYKSWNGRCSLSLGWIVTSRMPGSYVTCVFIIYETARLFSKVVVQVDIPLTSVCEFRLFHILANASSDEYS